MCESKAAYTLANALGKFIITRTSCKPGENDEPTANMEENKTSDKHCTTEPQTSFVFVEKTDW